MDIKTIEDCNRLSLEGTITFPEVVRRLAEAKAISYRVDLILLEKIVYGKGSESYRHSLQFAESTPIADAFNGSEVAKAIKEIQQNEIDYQTFLQHIMAAGTTHYEVFIRGRKAIYTGRNGDFHVENFPRDK